MIRPQKTVHLVWGSGEGTREEKGRKKQRDERCGWMGRGGLHRLNAPLASRSLLSEHTQDTALGSLAMAAMVLCPFSK